MNEDGSTGGYDLGASFLDGFTEDGVVSNSTESNSHERASDPFMDGFNYDGAMDDKSNSPSQSNYVGQDFLESLTRENGFEDVESFISNYTQTKAEMEQEDAFAEYSQLVVDVMDEMGYYNEQDAINYIESVLQQDEMEQYQRQQQTFAQLEQFEQYFKSRNGYDFDANVHQIPDDVFEIMNEHEVSLKTAHEIYDLANEQFHDRLFLEGLMG